MMRHTTRAREPVTGRGGRRSSALRNAVILILILALIVLGAVAFPSLQLRSETKELISMRLLTECDTAVQKVQRLSRTASTTSASTLQEIRSCIYAMDVLCQTYAGLTGEQLIPSSYFTTLYTQLSSYSSQMIAGSDTGTLQTAISGSVQELYVLCQQLN
ncbi:MAG: hypothetical protein IJ083_17360 [Clostridia bacterium]|nr:hypothetical protein [Clostridia bacterium]